MVDIVECSSAPVPEPEAETEPAHPDPSSIRPHAWRRLESAALGVMNKIQPTVHSELLRTAVTNYLQRLLGSRAGVQIFAWASGLFSNLDKSVATPIHCSDDEILLVQQTLACGVQPFPCRYLGIPLSVRKLKRSDEQFLVDKVAKRIPGWKGQLLNPAGRTTLVQSTLSAILVHTSIALCLSPWAIRAIDKLRRAFLWAGQDAVAGGRCKVAWEACCRPRALGGLGVSDLHRVGIALRARWVAKDRAAGVLHAQAEPAAQALFAAATVHSLGDGRSTLFWLDRWIRGAAAGDIALAVLRAVKPRKLRATVADALPDDDWVTHINGPLSAALLSQLSTLFDATEGLNLSHEPDTFRWIFSEDGHYSSATAYGAMFFGSSRVLGAKEIWKIQAPPRVRFFLWLVMHGRCWTGDRWFRHGLQPSDVCITCDQSAETMDPILLGCPFAREAWFLLLQRLQLQGIIVSEQPVIPWWLSTRKTLPKPLRKAFDSFFSLVAWSLWKERNARTFQRVSRTAIRFAADVQDELQTWLSSGFRSLAPLAVRAPV